MHLIYRVGGVAARCCVCVDTARAWLGRRQGGPLPPGALTSRSPGAGPVTPDRSTRPWNKQATAVNHGKLTGVVSGLRREGALAPG